MKFNIQLDLNDMWANDESLATAIKSEIKNAIQRAVASEVKIATKDVLNDYHKEIKGVAKDYGAKILSEMLKNSMK